MSVATIKRPWPIKPPPSAVAIRPEYQQLGLALTLVDGVAVMPRHGNRLATFTGSQLVAGRWGRAVEHDADGDLTRLGDSAWVPTQRITILFAWEALATGGDRTAFGVETLGTSDRCAVHLPYGDGKVYWDFGGAFSGSSRVVVSGLTYGNDVWAFTAGPRGMEIWQNGRVVGSHSNSPTRLLTTAPFMIGGVPYTPNSNLGRCHALHVFSEQLPQDAIRSLSADPMRLYAPRRVFVPLGGSGPATYNVALSESLTATSTLASFLITSRSLAESATAATPLASFLTTSHGITESAVASETVVGTIDVGGEVVEKAITEAVDAAASLSTTITVRGVVDYTAAADDSPAATITVEGAVSYAVAAAEAGAVTVTINASVGFSVEAAVNLAANAILNASIAESAAISVTFDDGAVITITPGDRVWTIPAESRAWTIPSESRSWSIPAEDRTWAISA